MRHIIASWPGSLGSSDELCFMMETHRHSLCSNVKDRVYALVGIASDVRKAWAEGSQALKPDYTKNRMDLALEVILFSKPMLISDLPASKFRALDGSRGDLERGGPWLDREWWPDTYEGLMSIRRSFTETHDVHRP
jgi:hypothetical protein